MCAYAPAHRYICSHASHDLFLWSYGSHYFWIFQLFTIYNFNLIIRFDAIVSADAFENLKPAPDIFLAASKILDVPPSEV